MAQIHSTNQSKTPKDIKDTFRTDPRLVRSLEARLGVRVIHDVAASDDWVCPSYWTERDDALSRNWKAQYGGALLDEDDMRGGFPVFWMNPPFSQKADFTETAARWAASGVPTLGVVPHFPEARWFADMKHEADRIIQFLGRINYYHPITRERMTGVNFPSAAVLWTPWGVRDPRPARLDRMSMSEIRSECDAP